MDTNYTFVDSDSFTPVLKLTIRVNEFFLRKPGSVTAVASGAANGSKRFTCVFYKYFDPFAINGQAI
jgi:hypothetical protein